MTQDNPNRLAEWLLILRARMPVARAHLAGWVAEVRAQPILLWETPAIRYTTYGLGVIVFAYLLSFLAGSISPPLPKDSRPQATQADFHVVCANESCGHHWVLRRKFGFDDFPVKCPRCEQGTGVMALKCNSDRCRGRWVAPKWVYETPYCSICGQPIR